MDNELRKVIGQLEELKQIAYSQCKSEYEFIVANRITSEAIIEHLFDDICNFIDDENFQELFWLLINYAETFDTGIGVFYRRFEELYFDGV